VLSLTVKKDINTESVSYVKVKPVIS